MNREETRIRPRTKSLYEQRETIVSAIDMDAWKHSWHLPKDKNGYVDWFSLETRNRVADILAAKRANIMARLQQLDRIQIPPESDYQDDES